MRRILLGIGFVLLAGLLLFAGGNAWLASKYGRSWLARKVSAKTGLTADVGPTTWTPWSGVIMRGLRLNVPGHEGAPLLEVRAIRVLPDLSRWREREVLLERVEVDAPRIIFTPELLRALMPKREAVESPPAAQPPEVAMQPLPEQTLPGATAAAPNHLPPVASNVVPAIPPQGPAVATPPVAVVPPSAPSVPKPVPAPAAPPKPVVTAPTGWLVIRDGEVRVEALGKDASIEAIAGEIPFCGKEATGKLTWQALSCGGERFEGGEIPVQWSTPVWRAGVWSGAIQGLQVEALAEGALRQGLPSQVKILVRPQPWKGNAGKGQVTWNAKSCEVQAVWAGFLQVPGSWNGRAIAHVHGIETIFEGKPMRFDDGILLADQKGPVVMLRDARLIGDELSLLGNATALGDGRFGAILRAVSPREQLHTVRGEFAKRLSFPAERVEMRPLLTPDRWFFDLKLGGTPEKMLLEVR